MRTLQAVILAAGEGTRMKSHVPKVLHPICGRPMIAYALDLAASAGVKQPIVILGSEADVVKQQLPKEVKAVIQPKPLGTGDAVLMAKKALGGTTGDLLILYADTPLLRRTTVQKLIETHFKTGATCTLLAAHLADPSGYGRIVRNETGQITGVIEDAEANAAQRTIREVNVGPLVCKLSAVMEALAAIKAAPSKKECYLTDIIAHAARQEGAKIQSTRVEEVAEALGVNSRAELVRAIRVTHQRIIDAHLHNGVTIEDPNTTFIDHGVSIGSDTVIRPCTVIESSVSIGKRCMIGPFARLRSGVTIADEVRLGNFAELVRTKVASRVRIQHVAYLGDAIVDEEANIGAGTITANYDGQAKHQTHIGKRAFIGSDTILIAPVKVGPGAVTGAGSVVTRQHDVPAKGVVVGVPARALDGHGRAHAIGEATGSPQPAGSALRSTVRHTLQAKPVKRTPAKKRSISARRVPPHTKRLKSTKRHVRTRPARRLAVAKRRPTGSHRKSRR